MLNPNNSENEIMTIILPIKIHIFLLPKFNHLIPLLLSEIIPAIGVDTASAIY